MPSRHPLLAVVVAAALTASGLTGGASATASTVDAAPGGYTPAPVSWSRCAADEHLPKGLECGEVAVPLDWDDVGGRRITLAVSRLAHTTKRYQGVLLVNPGGPGASGRAYAALRDSVPDGAGDSYDWIGFDPRGVGASKPALSCQADYFTGPLPPSVPSTKRVERAWITRTKSYVASCVRTAGALLGHITTEDTVKDMEAIRVALRRQRISFYGFSYGTSLGQVYGTLFPQRLRRMVLDSNVDPRGDAYQLNFDQDVAFQKVHRLFADWIATHDADYHLGTTRSRVIGRLAAAVKALDRRPVGTVGGDEFTSILLGAGYYQAVWPATARAASAWIVQHDRKALRAASAQLGAEPEADGYAVYLATTCNESQWPSYSVYRADSWRYHRVAPFETWANSWFNAGCVFWPLKRHTPVRIDGRAVTSALLIGETLEAATPYAGAVETRRRFPSSVLLAEPGGTSHAYSLFGNACVDDVIAAYLRDGALPERKPGGGADLTCAPLPLPVPDTGAGAASDSSGSARALSRLLLRD